MVLIFTDNEQLDRELNKKIEDSRIVYYPDYILQETIQVILILEDERVKELKDALTLGIYDIIFDPFDLDEVLDKIKNPSQFSNIAKYVKNILEQQNI